MLSGFTYPNKGVGLGDNGKNQNLNYLRDLSMKWELREFLDLCLQLSVSHVAYWPEYAAGAS